MSTTPPLRAAIYARYSTDKQRETSIDDQVRGCTRLCEQRGYVQVETYSDAAKSGGTVARPALKRLRSEERRVGKAGVSTCRSRVRPCQYKNKQWLDSDSRSNVQHKN